MIPHHHVQLDLSDWKSKEIKINSRKMRSNWNSIQLKAAHRFRRTYRLILHYAHCAFDWFTVWKNNGNDYNSSSIIRLVNIQFEKLQFRNHPKIIYYLCEIINLNCTNLNHIDRNYILFNITNSHFDSKLLKVTIKMVSIPKVLVCFCITTNNQIDWIVIWIRQWF